MITYLLSIFKLLIYSIYKVTFLVKVKAEQTNSSQTLSLYVTEDYFLIKRSYTYPTNK